MCSGYRSRGSQAALPGNSGDYSPCTSGQDQVEGRPQRQLQQEQWQGVGEGKRSAPKMQDWQDCSPRSLGGFKLLKLPSAAWKRKPRTRGSALYHQDQPSSYGGSGNGGKRGRDLRLFRIFYLRISADWIIWGKQSHALLLVWKAAPSRPAFSTTVTADSTKAISRGGGGWLQRRRRSTPYISESLPKPLPFDTTYYPSEEGIQIVDMVRMQLESSGQNQSRGEVLEQENTKRLEAERKGGRVSRVGPEILPWAHTVVKSFRELTINARRARATARDNFTRKILPLSGRKH
ncbi:homeobox protein SIX1 isoform X1 [Pantherophis guttatus]|uniref:Homeobox protein SIX1 isoform X1 n=1 Tax=Pantherophis guttatus TaxID=94885 RepID=A0A6P9D1F8_PANGU|nr:homeobox protein SIX1 isoform X1 [Pantherophis guttatus]